MLEQIADEEQRFADLVADLKKLSAPAFIIEGIDWTSSPPSLSRQQLKQAIKASILHCRLVVFEQSGHFTGMEFSYFKTAPGSWNPRSVAQDRETPLDSSNHIIAQLGPDERLGILVIPGNVGSESARCGGYIRTGPVRQNRRPWKAWEVLESCYRDPEGTA